MTVVEPSVELAAAAAARLRGLAERVVHRRPVAAHRLSFALSELIDPAFLGAFDVELRRIVTSEEKAIYQFSLRDPDAYPILREAFERRPRFLEASGRPLNYSRLMTRNDPQAIYVGSGRKLRQRIGQHLGRIGGPGTYSMRLVNWATSVRATVDLDCWLYEREMDPIELEALEQELWDARTPLLGKRGGR